MSAIDVLPGGYWDAAGQLHREFELGTLTGHEEELLASRRSRQPAALVTEVLSHCLRRLGKLDRVPTEVTRRLLVADRDYLLLRLRAKTFGEHVHGSLTCPWPDCGERVSIGFSLYDVPVEEPPHRAPLHTLAATESTPEIVFRLPDGSDEEELAAAGPAAAPGLLLARCVRRIGADERPAAAQVAALPAVVKAALEERMRQLAPKVELAMEAVCAECGRPFTAPFDLRGYFLGELRTDHGLLTREVHFLAFHYHWGEQEIMAMAREKRRRYIDVLADALAALEADFGQPGAGYGQRPAVWSVPAAASLPWTEAAVPLPSGPAPSSAQRPVPAGTAPGPSAASPPPGSDHAFITEPATVVIPDGKPAARPRRGADTPSRDRDRDRRPATVDAADAAGATGAPSPGVTAPRPAPDGAHGTPLDGWPTAATGVPLTSPWPAAPPVGPAVPAAPPVPATHLVPADAPEADPPGAALVGPAASSPPLSPPPPYAGASPVASVILKRRESRRQAPAGGQDRSGQPTTAEPPAAARRPGRPPAGGAAVPADRPVPPATAAFWDRRYLSRQPLRVLR